MSDSWCSPFHYNGKDLSGAAAREARIAELGGSDGIDNILKNERTKVRNELIAPPVMATVATSNPFLEAGMRETEQELNERYPGFTTTITTNSTKTYILRF